MSKLTCTCPGGGKIDPKCPIHGTQASAPIRTSGSAKASRN